MVIGADGAHSAVRRQMRRLALQELQKQSDLEAECPSVGLNEEKPFLTTYRCLWVRFPSHGGVVAGDAMETHGTGATVQLFAGERTAVVGVYERLSEPTIESQRYSPEDEDAMVKRWSKIPLNGNGLTLGDVYAERLQSGLVSLEEGVLDHWSWAGRIVLVGDAAHKFTPSTGAGCNNGLVDVAVLANLLNEEYNTAGESQNEPSAEGLSVAFTKYQHSRQESVRAACKNSSIATATATWKSTLHWFLDTWILPSLMVQKYLAGKQAIVTSKTPGFDYIESDKELTGNVPWVHSVA
jgi:2-polyprenyl-6-methoxyphenol hydroxylase-like FAD-dependent oxidoreductase